MGYKIREREKKKKMSQCELAEKSGVSRTVISGLEVEQSQLQQRILF